MQMTAQDAFNKMVRHCFKQGRKAQGLFGACKYRTTAADGTVLMCAVGCLIPDDVYQIDMEGTLYDMLVRLNQQNSPKAQELYHLINDDYAIYTIFRDAQQVHDNCATHFDGQFFGDDLREGFKHLAKINNLKMPRIYVDNCFYG